MSVFSSAERHVSPASTEAQKPKTIEPKGENNVRSAPFVSGWRYWTFIAALSLAGISCTTNPNIPMPIYSTAFALTRRHMAPPLDHQTVRSEEQLLRVLPKIFRSADSDPKFGTVAGQSNSENDQLPLSRTNIVPADGILLSLSNWLLYSS